MIIESELIPVCSTVDPELFFPSFPMDKEQHANVIAAKQLCEGCPLKYECLSYAMKHDVQGIWGGTTYMERRDRRRVLKIRPEPILSDWCKRGHLRTGANVYVSKAGFKKCKKCAADKAKEKGYE